MAARELELLDRVRVGDADAEHDLFAHWRPVVFDLIARAIGDLAEAEALATEALLLALEAARSGALGAPFAVVVMRCAHDLSAATRDRPTTAPFSLALALAHLGGPCPGLRDGGADPGPALGVLPAQQRHLVRLRYEQGLSFAAIAAELGVPHREVYALHAAALVRLRRELGCQEDG